MFGPSPFPGGGFQNSVTRNVDNGMFGPQLPPNKDQRNKSNKVKNNSDGIQCDSQHYDITKSKWDSPNSNEDINTPTTPPQPNVNEDTKVISGVLGVGDLVVQQKSKHRSKRKKNSKKKSRKNDKESRSPRSKSRSRHGSKEGHHRKKHKNKKSQHKSPDSHSSDERERKRIRRRSSSSYHRLHHSSSVPRSKSRSPQNIKQHMSRPPKSPVSPYSTSKHNSKETPKKEENKVKKRMKEKKNLLAWQPPLEDDEEEIILLKKHKDKRIISSAEKTPAENLLTNNNVKQDSKSISHDMQISKNENVETIKEENNVTSPSKWFMYILELFLHIIL
ncbi:uncharacterized protein LOC100182786 [Ciona intestinalis]